MTVRRTDPSTSRAAARAAVQFIPDHYTLILAALEDIQPAGKDRIGMRSRLGGVAVARRLTEMQRLGMVEQDGHEESLSGRLERRWKVRASK